MQKQYIPSIIALALLGAVALPAAANAAPAQPVKTPQIQGVGGNGQWNLVGSGSNAAGEVSVRSSEGISIGSVAGATGFKNKKVVVTDENGAEVCDSGATAGQSTAWMCTAMPHMLPVGDHTLTAVAYSKDGSRRSATSRPVTVHVLEGTPQTGAPTAPEVSVSHEGTTTTVEFTSGVPYGQLKTFAADGKVSVTKYLDEHGSTALTFDDSDLRGAVTYTAVVVDAKNVASDPTAFTVGSGQPDSTVVEAPGPVDPEFSVGTGDETIARPELGSVHEFNRNGVHWMVVNAKGVAGAEAVFTDARGVETKGEFSSTGSLVIRIDLPYGAEPVVALVQEVDGVASAPLTVRPSK
ncbi:hypothetical protein [Curtobacterium sp. MCBA15_001]|uniref:hypothetical protein n=1 Tax=Curtobacterium sp. MCBA15_001 TaxID=1898731 RepID=UPI0008DC8949|nr:hypothetical protein [Curtobacterium sp. MCBA15_001]OIH95505.1 hypothetical protein BIU90_02050 [Curtobacterium sp. MCBA15_001]